MSVAVADGALDLAACARIAAPDDRLACYDALAHRPTAPAAPRAAADGAQNFGLSPVQQHLTSAGPQTIQARIASISSNRTGTAVILLDSGQSWTVEDDDGRLSAGDEVTIKHAALGSFLLLTNANHRYRVRRNH